MNDGKIDIIYMGTPDYAKTILERLTEDDKFEISLVVTQPDRPVGRKRLLTAPPVKEFALEKGLEVLQPSTLKDEDIVKILESREVDFIVVAAFGQILPPEILSIAPCINLHASLLPEYRGASPVQNALLNGDSVTGITAMLMEKGLDSGPVLAYTVRDIPEGMNLNSLLEALSGDAAELTVEVLKNYDELLALPQYDALSTHCKKIRRSDGETLMENATELYNRSRAFEGWPGIFLPNGLKLLEIELLESGGEHIAGEIIAAEGDSIDVGCSLGAIRVHRLQPKSKKPMSARAFTVGRGMKVGDSLF